MKKLLLVGSDSIHIYNYAQLIAGYFDDILLITNKKRIDSNLPTMEVDFSLRNPLNYIFTVRRIKNIIREYDPTLIHIHQANSCSYYTLKAAGNCKAPKVVTAWGSDILISPNVSSFLKGIVKYNLKNASALTSDSSFMADEMRKLIPEKKLDITIANFGITKEITELPKENIIFSNRLHKKLYRIEKIIHAFKKFMDAGNASWELIIAGTGEETNALKSLAVQLRIAEKVRFVGWLDEKQNGAFYSKAKMFVSVPESDATSVSLLEAMANGCLPVLSDIPANREWIRNGRNGMLVKNIDGDFLSDALNICSDDVIRENKKIIAEKGTKEVNRKIFLELYDHLLKRQ